MNMAIFTNSELSRNEKNDTVRIRYIHRLTEDDARIFERNLQKTVIYVNDQVTTHLIMPENIKLVDISTRQARRQPVRRQHRPSEAQVHADGQRTGRNGNGHR
jgi:nucleoid DNA-binding protein